MKHFLIFTIFLFVSFGEIVSYLNIPELFLDKVYRLQDKCLKSDCGHLLPNSTLCQALLNSSNDNLRTSLKQIFESFTKCQNQKRICGQCFRNITFSNQHFLINNYILFSKDINLLSVGYVKFLENKKYSIVGKQNNIHKVTFSVVFPNITLEGCISKPENQNTSGNQLTNQTNSHTKVRIYLVNLELRIRLIVSNEYLKVKIIRCPRPRPTPTPKPSTSVKVKFLNNKFRDAVQVKNEIKTFVNTDPIRLMIRKLLVKFIERIVRTYFRICKKLPKV